jgi:hypothetical protein
VRYVDSLNLKDNIKVFILIEPGYGFMLPVLRERHKTSKIIVLHIGDFPQENGFPALNSTDSKEVQKFLELQTQETGVDHIRIIEWRPSLNYYREAYVKLFSQVVEFLKRKGAEERTVAAFGRRWVKNFFNNLAKIDKTLLYKQTDIPVIITGSGPSLEKALPVIKKKQADFLIIAASSSITALYHNGITPDLTIATDGGSWALWHLYSAIRYRNADALAINLCAALPSQFRGSPALLINDGSFWQSIILHELGLASAVIPQKGTVTATAVELAMLLSSGNIYLAGMDFSVNDIRTHVKPYSFDNLLFGKANRFLPVYSESFIRSAMIRKGASMDVYASWFKNELALWPKRIFFIGDSNIFKDGSNFLAAEKSQENPKKNNSLFKTICADNSNQFYKKGISALLGALNNNEYTQNIKQELASLLFAGKAEETITIQEIEKAIKEIAFLNPNRNVSYE